MFFDRPTLPHSLFMNKSPISVHAFSPVRPTESGSDAAREEAILLSLGRSVAHAGCRTIGWRTPNARDSGVCAHHSHISCCSTHQDPRLGFLNNAFIYLPAPPLVPAAAALATCTTKEWDTHPSESEKFSTADLEPFGSTLFGSCLPAVPKESRNRLRSSSPSPMRPPTKRKRVEEDMGPLDKLIPLVLDPSRAMPYMLTTIYQAPLHSRSSQVIASRIAPRPT